MKKDSLDSDYICVLKDKYDNEINDGKKLGITIGPVDHKCSILSKFDTYSCMDLSVLKRIAIAHNKWVEKEKDINFRYIDMDAVKETENHREYKIYLLKELSDIYKKKCTSQLCWLDQKFMKYTDMDKKKLRRLYRPIGPKGKFEWLKTSQIHDSIIDLELYDNEFVFIGAVPMDFYTMPYSKLQYPLLDKIRENDFDYFVNKNKFKIGLVVNLDTHNMPGSHWVSVFIDLKKGYIYFYDSCAGAPDEEIKLLCDEIKKYVISKNINKKNIINYNKTRHQFKDTECGVYSINFIMRMIRGDSFETIISQGIDDDKMNRCRKHIYL